MAAPIRTGGYGKVVGHPPPIGKSGRAAKTPKPDAAPIRRTSYAPPAAIDNWWQTNAAPSALPGVAPSLPANTDLASAQKLVDAILAGNQKAIDSIHQQMLADNAAREAHIRAVYQSLADMQRSVAPQVQQTYQNAATDTSTFGKGYSDGLQRALAGNTAQGNAILQNIGAPQGQMLSSQQGTQAADVLYGTGGDIPASALTREGAALTSAAAQLPGTALGYGTQQALQSSAAGQQKIDDFLSQSGLALAQKRSDLLAQEYGNIRAQRTQQAALKTSATAANRDYQLRLRAIADQEKVLGLRAQNQQQSLAVRIAGLNQRIAASQAAVQNQNLNRQQRAQAQANLQSYRQQELVLRRQQIAQQRKTKATTRDPATLIFRSTTDAYNNWYKAHTTVAGIAPTAKPSYQDTQNAFDAIYNNIAPTYVTAPRGSAVRQRQIATLGRRIRSALRAKGFPVRPGKI